MLLLATCLLVAIFSSAPSFAQTQSHPLNQIAPIFTVFDLNNTNITNLNYLNYSGGILYRGTQGIPTADIAALAVTGAKIASGAITASKLSNPLGGSINASAYYDSDNPLYLLDAASTMNSLLVAGKIGVGSLSPVRELDIVGVGNFTKGINSSGSVIVTGGSVGIGIDSPSELLHVFGDAFIQSRGGNGPTLTVTGGSQASSILALRVDNNIGSASFVVSDGRRAGVRTASPVKEFDVVGTINATSQVCIGGDCRSAWPGGPGASGWTISSSFVYNDTSGVKVGIGTNNPQQEFEVVGDINNTGWVNTTNVSASGKLYGLLGSTDAVPTAAIQNDAVTGAKIAAGVVTSTDLANPLGGSVNGTVYYDSDNSAYYLDPAATGTSFSSAGSIILNNNEFLYGKNSVSSDSLLIGINSSDTLQVGDRAFNNPLVITNGNNLMAFETNGIERMRISADGNVGIGTASPGSKLDVADAAGSEIRVTDTGSHNFRIGTPNGVNRLYFQEGTGAEILSIDGGNRRVGIGTTSPAATLDVNGGLVTRSQTNSIVFAGDIDEAKWLQSLGGYRLTFESDGADTTSIGIGDVSWGGRTFRPKVSFERNGNAYIAGSLGAGVATTTLPRTLYVNNTMRLEPRASAPSSASSGDIYVDSTPSPDELCFYDGAAWQGISSGTDANCA